ncbi:alkaline phosphatase family protein [Marinilongibacter aquaticus]|uniref:alkaline phosphatase family protein n=1 Tax=Marinilongibacter aquaticus TaxID=2975157 RepID=UPI0021BD3EEE|nr:alkaline phosphatase family protein [Marinilongibacter aquaticus]UBM58109.1 alkaline phosphatase family protein [Marinilongibacter aquaticus]
MKKTFILLLISSFCVAQKTENVVLITLDGVRWQEVFAGADAELINNEKYTESIQETKDKFWDESAESRRKKLMPFLWSTIENEGVVLGNREKGSKVDVKNIYGFSYPGYNEILTGYPDKKVDSNDKNYNENETVLEFLNKMPEYKGKVAAFTTWDAFPYIINDKRSGILVNSAGMAYEQEGNERVDLLNEIQERTQRFDYITYLLGREHFQVEKPKVMFFAFDETDEFAHAGKYKDYLHMINEIDGFIRDLWHYCQSTQQYRNKTTFIIATDHGRGDAVKDQWTGHGQSVKDCYSIWMAAIGPDTKALGELSEESQAYQSQISATIAKLLGQDFKNGHVDVQAVDYIISAENKK